MKPFLRSSTPTDWLTAVFTVVLGVATTGLVITAIKQHYDTIDAINATNRLATAAEDYAAQTKTMAAAAETSAQATVRLSTANRAYLFASYTTPQAPEVAGILEMGGDRHTFLISVKYSISNVGQTTAIITKIESHLFIKDLMSPSSSLSVAPLPNSSDWIEDREGNKIRLNGIPGVEIDQMDVPMRFFISANTTIPIEEQFGYFVRSIRNPYATNKWFYIRISFLDMYAAQHWSCYYVRSTGTETEPVPEFCNDWDH